MDKEDYFDKYFQMDTILIIFFYKYIILVLNSVFQLKVNLNVKIISHLLQDSKGKLFFIFFNIKRGERKGIQGRRAMSRMPRVSGILP